MAELLWYAVQVRPRHEKKVEEALVRKGYECLLPIYRVKRKWSDRTKTLELPLFPGYVFSRFDVQVRLPILKTPGVLGIVGVARTPHPIDETEISQILAVHRSGEPAKPFPFLKVGQRVRITAGPLTGVEGLLAQHRNEAHVVLSITILQKSISVHVDSDSIKAL